MTLTKKIVLAMVAGLVVGILLNIVIPSVGWIGDGLQRYLVDGLLDTVGTIFVRSLKLLVVPLVFVSLVCGAGALSEQSRIGPMTAKTIGLYIITTAVAISLALLVAHIIEPGVGMDISGGDYVAHQSPPFKDVIVNIFPTNPVQAMASGEMLQIIVFAVLFGVALAHAGEKGRRIYGWFEDINQVMMKLVMLLINLAPYGIFALLAGLFADLGVDAIAQLIVYFLTVLLVLLVHGLLVYPALLKLLSGLKPQVFLAKIKPLLLFAFSTSSSNASIPVTLRIVKERLGVHNRIASFTVPLGATINMDGTAIMQGVATVFIAQAYNIEIGLVGYLMVIATATMASIGTAGVPGVGLITLALVLEQAGLPVEGIALIIGVDRLLDMTRTAVNVAGDSMVTVVVAKSEHALDKAQFDAPIDSSERN